MQKMPPLSKEDFERQYSERKAAGLCVRCGKAPAIVGKVQCVECREKDRARQRAKYQPKRERWMGCDETCPEYCPYKDCMRPSPLCSSLDDADVMGVKEKSNKTAVKRGSMHEGWKYY